MRNGLDLRRLADWLVRLEAALGIDQVRGKDGVDERRLAETGLACNPKSAQRQRATPRARPA